MRIALYSMLALACLSLSAGSVFAQAPKTAAARQEAEIRQMLEELRRPPAGVPRAHIAEMLGECGEPAVPLLLQTIDDSEEMIAQYAFVALSRMQENAHAAIPRLTEIARDESHPFRRDAVATIALIGPRDAEVGNLLNELLVNDAKGDLALSVLHSYPVLRLQWKQVFVSALRHSQRSVRSEALMLLGEMETTAAPMADPVMASCDGQDYELTEAACRALTRMGVDAQPALIRLSASDSVDVRHQALAALSRSRPVTSEAAARFKQAAADADAATRSWAARGLAPVIHLTEARQVLLKLTSDEDADVRWQAVRAIRQATFRLPEVASAMREAMSDVHPSVRLEAAVAYWQATGEVDQPSRVLEELVATQSNSVGRASTAALERMGR